MTVRSWGQHPVDIGLEFQAAGLSRDARTLFLLLPMTARILPCGLLELTERRWASESAMTLAEVEAALIELAATQRDSTGTTWIAIDWDTAELLIPNHIRTDGSLKNPRHVKGIWNAIDKITSAHLRQVVLDLIASIPDFPPRDPHPDRTTDQAIDRASDCPIVPAMDSPRSLIPEPGTSSSSSAVTSPPPTTNPDDDDPATATLDPDSPDERARLACELVGDHDFDQARLAGRITQSPTHYRQACRRTAAETWRRDAYELAETYPTWPPTEIAEYLIHGALAGVGPSPPSMPAVPDIDLRDVPVAELENGALVVDLDAHRRSLNPPTHQEHHTP